MGKNMVVYRKRYCRNHNCRLILIDMETYTVSTTPKGSFYFSRRWFLSSNGQLCRSQRAEGHCCPLFCWNMLKKINEINEPQGQLETKHKAHLINLYDDSSQARVLNVMTPLTEMFKWVLTERNQGEKLSQSRM